MNWLNILLESSTPRNKKNKKARVIKGIANINENIYLLDYVLFSNFKWWTAIPLENVEQYSSLKEENIEPKIFYNSESQTFCDFEQLPENIKKNII